MRPRVLVAVIVMVASVLRATTPAFAAPATPGPGLDFAVTQGATVSLGQFIYQIGGLGSDPPYANYSLRTQVVRFDPITGRSEVVAHLPTGCMGLAAAVVDRNIYVFGGSCDNVDYGNAIVRISPDAPEHSRVRVMQARLDAHLTGASAASAGGRVYVLGGINSATAGPTSTVRVYDPARDELRVSAVPMPLAVANAAAASDGTDVFVVGGTTTEGALSAAIMRHSPSTDLTRLEAATLPTPRNLPAAAFDGQSVAIFGGCAVAMRANDEILRFDPRTGVLTPSRETLPNPRCGLGAAFSPATSSAWLIGGYDQRSLLQQIVEYRPPAASSPLGQGDEVRTSSGVMPTARSFASTVSTGRRSYAFGGVRQLINDVRGVRVAADDLAEIVEYDTETRRSKVLRAALPTPRSATSAVWSGSAAYIFGGTSILQAHRQENAEIIRFDPATETALPVGLLPTPRAATSAAWLKGCAYVIGGHSFLPPAQTVILDEIVRYCPDRNEVTTLPTRLPEPRFGTMAYSDGRYIYILGGVTEPWDPSMGDDILRFDPETGQVQRLPETLPSPVSHAGMATRGDTAYIIGGTRGDGGGSTDRIITFRPRDGASPASAQLPFPAAGILAASGSDGIDVLSVGHLNHVIHLDAAHK